MQENIVKIWPLTVSSWAIMHSNLSYYLISKLWFNDNFFLVVVIWNMKKTMRKKVQTQRVNLSVRWDLKGTMHENVNKQTKTNCKIKMELERLALFMRNIQHSRAASSEEQQWDERRISNISMIFYSFSTAFFIKHKSQVFQFTQKIVLSEATHQSIWCMPKYLWIIFRVVFVVDCWILQSQLRCKSFVIFSAYHRIHFFSTFCLCFELISGFLMKCC